MKEKRRIEKERLWIFAPANNVVFDCDIVGTFSKEEFVNAIHVAADSFEALKSKVEIDEENVAWFVPCDQMNIQISETYADLQTIIMKQEQIAFDLGNGEYLRFFYQPGQDQFHLVLIAHHIIGDGLSFITLIKQIVEVLHGNTVCVDAVPAKCIDIRQLAGDTKLSFLIRTLMKSMNKKWDQSGKAFEKKDFDGLFTNYWKTHCSNVAMEEIAGNEYRTLIDYSKRNKLTINTIITTAFFEADLTCKDCGMAVDIRNSKEKVFGNYASGISAQYRYDPKKTYEKNAAEVQKRIYHKLNQPNKRMFLLNFMSGMRPTLVDGIYFAACENYENKVAINFAKMFGYMGNTNGISITNLKAIEDEKQEGKVTLKNVNFIPPLVLNAKRIIGVVSIHDRLSMTMHLDANTKLEIDEEVFKRAVTRLKTLK
jgi:hypothetical protein